MKIISFDIGRNNMAYCIMEDGIILDWKRFSIMSNSLDECVSNLFCHLDELDLDEEYVMAYEKQNLFGIKVQNTPTLFISGALVGYFTLCSNCIKIICVPSSYKLDRFRLRENESIKDLSHLKKGYYKNKKLSIEYCKVFLSRNESNSIWQLYFESQGTHDNSDCLLQCISLDLPSILEDYNS